VKTFNKRFVDFADWVSAATGLMTGGAAPFFRDSIDQVADLRESVMQLES